MVINTKENVKKNLFKERYVLKTINKFNMSAVSPHIQNWSLIDWKKIYKYVKKLRQRIFRAEQLGQKKKSEKTSKAND
ncbi:reverse transcriptase N-terminal domain-containing protein [Clostridium botulinum]|nr:reverse transcriptase N-terminal domain-containing protein [Clostridium botulinum]UUN82824.1 reverse transcriptase N-terminal domain-containing protein [Clostridium botulinum]